MVSCVTIAEIDTLLNEALDFTKKGSSYLVYFQE